MIGHRKSAITFALDENFAPLGKGLVLSLRALGFPDESADLCLVDIGCAKPTLEWMAANGCHVTAFDAASCPLPPPPPGAGYVRAMMCRPFLPRIFPGYACYLNIDTDAWVQKRESLELALSSALGDPGRVALCPFVDFSYSFNYLSVAEGNYLQYLSYFHDWYLASYGEEVANRWAGRALFSAGMFALAAESPLWQRWAQELARVYARDYTGKRFELHLAEQIALNHLIYSTDAFVPLEAIHNYHCHVGVAERDAASDEVVIKYAPRRPLGVVHLSYSSKMMRAYMDAGMLWDRGRYLSQEETQALLRLGHY